MCAAGSRLKLAIEPNARSPIPLDGCRRHVRASAVSSTVVRKIVSTTRACRSFISPSRTSVIDGQQLVAARRNTAGVALKCSGSDHRRFDVRATA